VKKHADSTAGNSTVVGDVGYTSSTGNDPIMIPITRLTIRPSDLLDSKSAKVLEPYMFEAQRYHRQNHEDTRSSEVSTRTDMNISGSVRYPRPTRILMQSRLPENR
jgi:hypothetical protein